MAYKKLPGIRAFYKNEPPALKQREEVKITPKDPLPMGLPYSESYLESRGISMEDYKKLIASRLDNQREKYGWEGSEKLKKGIKSGDVKSLPNIPRFIM